MDFILVMEEPDRMERPEMETGADDFYSVVIDELLKSYVPRIKQLDDEGKYLSSDEETSKDEE